MGITTDLALEAREVARKDEANEIPGVRVVEQKGYGMLITRVDIHSEEGVQRLGKPIGTYVTLEADSLASLDIELREDMAFAVADELRALIKREDDFSALVVGLGNYRMTPDALGPRVSDGTMVTRHLYSMIPEQMDNRLRTVSAFTPGVLGMTGMETGEVVRGVVDRLKPDVVIAIDSLAARSASRVGNTVQLTDSGISPGSGLGTRGKALTKESLGVPVIALGIPMVVYASTLVSDALESAFSNRPASHFGNLIKEATEQMGDLVVTPKEIDTMIDILSDLLSLSINLALHDGVSVTEVRRFFQ